MSNLDDEHKYKDYPSVKAFIRKDIDKQTESENILSCVFSLLEDAGTDTLNLAFSPEIRPPLLNKSIADFVGGSS